MIPGFTPANDAYPFSVEMETGWGTVQSKLEKTLGLSSAVGLAITMVVGSGLLILPGLAYVQAGGAAIYAWTISAVVSIPLLIVFAKLGAEIPGAGGIAGFMQAVFSRRSGAATEILILGTIPGGAALAITGGKYISSLFSGEQSIVVLGTLFVLLIGGFVNYFGAKVSGKVQQVLAIVLVLMLALVAAVALLLGDTSRGEGIPPLPQALNTLPTVGLVFFAFVGWELMSFTSEEFKNPKRDFPLMIVISFVIVVALYLLVAVTIQCVLPRTHPGLTQAPIAGMLAIVLGDSSAKVISFVGILVVVANFISVVWAFSRLSFSSAREGLLPGFLARMDSHVRVPRFAVIASIAAFSAVSLLYFTGITSQTILFELAGISFFFSYILAVVAYTRKSKSTLSKGFGALTFFAVCLVFIGFGFKIVYPIALFALGYLIHAMRYSTKKRSV